MKRVAVGSLLLLLIAGACKRETETAVNANAANKVSTRTARLYFEAPEMLLVSESRALALPESPAAALPLIVAELMKGPAGGPLLRLWPEDTVVRGAYLVPGGTAIVDLGGATLSAGWQVGSHHELMAIYSLVQTVTVNLREARQVRILVNGSAAETLGGHVSAVRSLRPMPGLVHPSSR